MEKGFVGQLYPTFTAPVRKKNEKSPEGAGTRTRFSGFLLRTAPPHHLGGTRF